MSSLSRVAGTILATALALSPGLAVAQLTDLALTGEPATQPGLVFWEFGDPQVDDAGTVLVFGKTRPASPPVTRRDCLFSITSAGVATEVACVKSASPASGRAYRVFKELAKNAAGDAAFYSGLSGSVKGIFRVTGGSVGTAAITGTPVPGGGSVEELFDPSITASGAVVFRADLSGVLETLDQAILRCSGPTTDCSAGAGLTKLVQKRDPVPDRPGRIFCGFTEVDARDSGIAFVATTRVIVGAPPGDCATATSGRVGVFRRLTAGTIETIALEDEGANPGPGAGGTVYAGFKGRPSIEDDGNVAFLAGVDGLLLSTNIYVCNVGTCPAAPAAIGVAAGVSDDEGHPLTRLTPPVLADNGDIAFGGASGGRSCGVYIMRVGGDIETVAFRDDDVPGLAGPEKFGCFGQPDMSPGGAYAFRGDFRRSTAPRNGSGIFLLP